MSKVTKEEILKGKVIYFQRDEDSEIIFSVDKEDVLEAMELYAQQEAIAFAEWVDKYYDRNEQGFFSVFNNGSHGRSHISPKYYQTISELYQIYKESK